MAADLGTLVKIYANGILGSGIIIAYVILLIHIQLGNKNKWMLVNSFMVLLSGIFFMMVFYGYIKIYVQDHINMRNVWIIGIGTGFSDGF
jgi:hypothetical protein